MKKCLYLLLMVFIGILLSACGGAGDSQTFTLNEENTGAVSEGGAAIDFGDYLIEGEQELQITDLGDEEDAEAGLMIKSFEFKLGEQKEFDDIITIRLPYDASYIEAGTEENCVCAKYLNEETGEWEDVLYEVDKENDELVIYTDHLSVYGAFCVKNEGLRSAYITNVIGMLSPVSVEDATGTLSEYVNGGGGAAAANTGSLIAGELFNQAGGVASNISTAGNIMNMATLGDPVFDSVLGTKAYELVGNVGKVASIVKIGSAYFRDDLKNDEILGLYKDAADLMIGSIGGAALGVAMSGVWVFDMVITEMFETGMEIKMENIGMVYQYYNDTAAPRSLKEWRKLFIQITEENADNPELIKTKIDQEIDAFCKRFWELDSVEQSNIAADMPGVDYKRMSYPTTREIEALTADYKKNLYERLYPVGTSVRNYMLAKAEQEYLKELNKLKAFYNQSVSLTITEQVDEGATPLYAGYTVRFAKLNDTAVKENWTGKMNEKGSASTKFTLLGFMLAGSPDKLEFFKPEDDPDTATPTLKVPFTVKVPETKVEIGGVPTLDELAGYYADGTLMFSEVFISDALMESLTAEMAEPEDEEESDDIFAGCDLPPLLLGLKEMEGVVQDSPFSIVKTGDSSVNLLFDESDESADNVITATYAKGVLSVTYLEEDYTCSLSGPLYCTFNADRSVINVTGDLKFLIEYPESDFYAIIHMEGSKAMPVAE